MDLDQVVTISSNVLAQEVGGETVLLELEGEVYFGLDEVGTRVWQLLGTGKSLSSLIDVLVSEYDVEESILLGDVEALLARLRESRLIEFEVAR